MRQVRFFLGSFGVVIPVEETISIELLYTMRNAVTETFREAQAEFIQDATVFQSAITPHVFVSRIRQGSLDFQVLYHAILNLPWHEIQKVANQGLKIVERIGAIAAGLETLRRVGSGLTHRIFGDQWRRKTVKVRHESALESDPHAFSDSNRAGERARALLDDPKPRAMLVVLDEPSASALGQVLSVPSGSESCLGGHVIIHDMNMIMNGVSNLEELPLGSPFCLHNPAAMGLHLLRDSRSLFDACADPGFGLRISGVTLDHAEFGDERPLVEGPSLDSEDLPE